MSCRLSVFLLVFLRVQSIDLTHTRSASSLLGFELPEIDGSAVDICRIFADPTPDNTPPPITTTTTTTITTTTTTPITKKKVVATTKKPAVQSPPRKPETKKTGTPIRPQPAPAGPITDSLLHYLLAISRAHAAGSLPGLNAGYGMTSDSDESAATPLKRAGRTNENRWKIGLSSSEDSSDEF